MSWAGLVSPGPPGLKDHWPLQLQAASLPRCISFSPRILNIAVSSDTPVPLKLMSSGSVTVAVFIAANFWPPGHLCRSGSTLNFDLLSFSPPMFLSLFFMAKPLVEMVCPALWTDGCLAFTPLPVIFFIDFGLSLPWSHLNFKSL